MIYNAHYYTLQSAMLIVDTIVNAYFAHYILQSISFSWVSHAQSIMLNSGYYCKCLELMYILLLCLVLLYQKVFKAH